MTTTLETKPVTDEATRRILALEKRCRGLARVAWVGCLAALFAVLVLVLQRVGERGGTIRAQGFVLEDLDGRTRGSLDILASANEVRLQLADLSERTRLLATVGGGGIPQVQLRDDNNRARIGMGILADGSPIFVLNDAEGMPRVTLRTQGEGHDGRLHVRTGEGEDFYVPLRGGGR